MTTNEQDLGPQASGPSTADEVGYWDARLRAPDCTDEDRANFAAWRDAKPENRHAFETAQAIVQTLREHSSRADVRALRDAARQSSFLRREEPSRTNRAQRTLAIAAALALFAIAASIWTAKPQFTRQLIAAAVAVAEYATAQTYETGTAQRSTITLQDGSTVELNAKTRIRVAFNTERRRVELLSGQALFHVAKNPHRPFIVRAADRDITAVGTAFDVRLDATTVRVTLIEGKVNVTQAAGPGTQALEAGQQLIAELSPAPTQVSVRSADTARVTSWREGRVFIEDLTLADAISEMNKYSQVQIRIDDSDLTHLRVNGMFRAGEQQAFINALEDYFPIAARYETDERIVLERRH